MMTKPAPRPTDLVDAVRRGEIGATDRLLDAWLPPVLVWCRRLCGPGVDPEDAAHDAMVIVITRLDTLEEPARFPGWLFRVVRSVIAAHRRRAWLRRWVPGLWTDPVDPADDPARRAERSQVARRVQVALEDLPPAQREALVLCDLEDRTAEEVAELLDVPVGTVKSRLRLARERFRGAALRHGIDASELDSTRGSEP